MYSLTLNNSNNETAFNRDVGDGDGDTSLYIARIPDSDGAGDWI